MTETTSTPAQRREKRARRRRIAWWAIGVGVLVAFVAVYILLIEVTAVNATNLVFANCGAALSPVQWSSGAESALCADALSGFILAGGLVAALALILIAGGTVLLARTPRSMWTAS